MAVSTVLLCHCGKLFTRYNRHIAQRQTLSCSTKCSITVRPGGPPRKRRKFFTGICVGCGNEFKKTPNNKGAMQFCSLKCMGASRRRDKNPNWKGGIARRSAANAAVLRRVREVGYCERCGSTDNLQGHHKKWFSTHSELGAVLANIEVLCAQCHGDEHPTHRGALARPRVKTGKEIACIVCHTLFYVPPARFTTAKFCSISCHGRWRILPARS